MVPFGGFYDSQYYRNNPRSTTLVFEVVLSLGSDLLVGDRPLGGGGLPIMRYCVVAVCALPTPVDWFVAAWSRLTLGDGSWAFRPDVS